MTQVEPEMSVPPPVPADPGETARHVLDLSPTAANCLLGMLHGAAVHGLIPVAVWNRLVGEAEEFAEKGCGR